VRLRVPDQGGDVCGIEKSVREELRLVKSGRFQLGRK
jgi:hypothetical protein